MALGSGILWVVVLLIIAGWPLFFLALWSGIVMLMSLMGGWHRLAKSYAVAEIPAGGQSWMSGMIGIARYNRTLTVATDANGLYLNVRRIFRIGHPPLFIPWKDIRNPERSSFLARDYITFEVGTPTVARIKLQAIALDGTLVIAAV